MALQHISAIEDRIRGAGISETRRTQFLSLLQRYQKDFLSLVEQNRMIDRLTEQMDLAATQVSELVQSHVESTNRSMEEKIQTTNEMAQQRTEWMNWVILIAIALGVLFTIKITSQIVRPMQRMAELLEELTYTDLVRPVPHVEGGRDEVNAMAGYLNALAEQRNRFINWWKNSMDEVESYEQLKNIMEHAQTQDTDAAGEVVKIKHELLNALSIKKALASKEFSELKQRTENIINAAAVLQHPSVSRMDVEEQSKAIHYSAEMIRKSLDMLSKET
jgi:HAMP domain-containing protein